MSCGPWSRTAGPAIPTGSACSDNWRISTRSFPFRSRRSGPLWKRQPRIRRMTTGSGWVERTSPSVPASLPKPNAGSTTACERRPRDASVWKSRLDLALATGDVAGTRETLGHLTPDRVSPDEVLALRAWFAAQSGDQERERQALEKLIEQAPGQVQAVERLAELELLAGRPESAARLRARRPSWIGPRSITRSS